MKKAILFRLGGLGDIIILTCIAKELKKRGYIVDGVFGSPTANIHNLIGNLGLFNKIYEYGRHLTGLDIAKIEGDNWVGVNLLKDGYDLIGDYKFSIELNSHYRHMANSPGKEWMVSQNSNFVNWMDMMFSWVGIDPTTIKDEDKIPMYRMEDNEKEWAHKLLRSGNPDYVVSIQTNASSLTRTWYHPQRLPRTIRDDFEPRRVDIVAFDGSQWHLIRGKHEFPVQIPKDMDPVRASCALVGASDLFIGADSGFSHIAEALSVKSITLYTTVPAWTRMKYYKHAKAIEPVGDTFNGVQCRPCFVLDRYCPRVREKAFKEFTERELKIKWFMENQIAPADAAVELNTTPQGVQQEANMMQQRFNALIEMQAPCTETITTERIMDAVREILWKD